MKSNRSRNKKYRLSGRLNKKVKSRKNIKSKTCVNTNRKIQVTNRTNGIKRDIRKKGIKRKCKYKYRFYS